MSYEHFLTLLECAIYTVAFMALAFCCKWVVILRAQVKHLEKVQKMQADLFDLYTQTTPQEREQVRLLRLAKNTANDRTDEAAT